MDYVALNKLFNDVKKNIDAQERNIYIVAGVLGAVDLVLIIGVILVAFAIFQVKKQVQEADIQRKIEDEMNAQKFSAYTGEEMHRKMQMASPATKPGSDSEYAFNAPYVENRLGMPNTPQSKFNRL